LWYLLKPKKIRIAIPTTGNKKLNDKISEFFGKTPTFTIIDLVDGKVEKIKVTKNPASAYQYGSGPIAVKVLVDSKVNAVVVGKIGPGASTLLKQHKIQEIKAKPGVKVAEALEEILKNFKAFS